MFETKNAKQQLGSDQAIYELVQTSRSIGEDERSKAIAKVIGNWTRKLKTMREKSLSSKVNAAG